MADPLFLRWENTHPPHAKFYELEVELALFFPKRLVRRWGRLGGPGRCLQQVVADPEQLVRQVEAVARRRRQHGYDQVEALYVPAVGQQAA